ncbi:MAG: GGDEF domain-containing protein [Parvularculaceae bacterium]
MKIKGPGTARAADNVVASRTVGKVEGLESVPLAAEVSISGIPEAELTPRVRVALMALMREVAELRAALADSQRRMAELEQLASADPLLGILNRRAFVGELGRALAMVERYGQPSSLIFIDLDDLKKINDAHGHAVGDDALQHIAATVSANIRQTDIFGRLGGDEFALILTNTPREGAEAKARALKSLISAESLVGDVKVSVACGIVELSRDTTPEAALSAADKIMYEEKKRRS